MSSNTDLDDDVQLDWAMLDALRGDDDDYAGPLDHPCPLCGPYRSSAYNQTRPVLRTWRPSLGFITFNCARCGAKGYVRVDASFANNGRPRFAPPSKPIASDSRYKLLEVERIWNEATPILPKSVMAYFRWRGIPIEEVPQGVLRLHPACPWWGKQAPCIVARFSDTGPAN
jgi:hypothetical protein